MDNLSAVPPSCTKGNSFHPVVAVESLMHEEAAASSCHCIARTFFVFLLRVCLICPGESIVFSPPPRVLSGTQKLHRDLAVLLSVWAVGIE